MTRYTETDEQRLLGETVRDLFVDFETSEIRDAVDDPRGYSPERWKTVAVDLGLAGLLVPEDAGGAGAGLTDAAVVLREMGRVPDNGPFLATAVLAPLVLREAHGDVSAVQAAICGGGVVAVTGLHRGAAVTRLPAEVTAERSGDHWLLTGRATNVVHGWAAEVLLVVAAAEGGLGVFAVRGDDAGHERHALTGLDLSRRQSDHVFSGAVGTLVVDPARGVESLVRVADLAAAALSAEQVGGAKELLDRTVAYARERYQFGRAIGSFQAIKHRVADMAVAVEGAIAASQNALEAAEPVFAGTADAAATADAARAVAVAGDHCSQTYLSVASASLQIHGGIGMAWEHDTHLFLRRAKFDERILGTPVEHRRRLVELLTS
jgi:alkylation response protein AidB-like acyl-CoA dehydrogenase